MFCKLNVTLINGHCMLKGHFSILQKCVISYNLTRLKPILLKPC